MNNGEKSEQLWSGKAGEIIKVDPPGSVISKILVNYRQTDVVYGIKLFTKEGNCVLEAGRFTFEDTKEIDL